MAGACRAQARAPGAHVALYKERQQETDSQPQSGVLLSTASQGALQKCATLPWAEDSADEGKGGHPMHVILS